MYKAPPSVTEYDAAAFDALACEDHCLEAPKTTAHCCAHQECDAHLVRSVPMLQKQYLHKVVGAKNAPALCTRQMKTPIRSIEGSSANCRHVHIVRYIVSLHSLAIRGYVQQLPAYVHPPAFLSSTSQVIAHRHPPHSCSKRN